MNVIKFIEKFGWDDCSKENIWFHFGCSSERAFEEIYGFRVVENLKRYVDAYELVQSYGGLDKSKELSCSNNVIFNVHPLRKAITLVEEVGECDE